MEWTSIKDRLPIKAGFYLVTRKMYTWDNELYFYVNTEYYDKVGGKFKDDKWIIAWMPFPAPYKENEDETSVTINPNSISGDGRKENE